MLQIRLLLVIKHKIWLSKDKVWWIYVLFLWRIILVQFMIISEKMNYEDAAKVREFNEKQLFVNASLLIWWFKRCPAVVFHDEWLPVWPDGSIIFQSLAFYGNENVLICPKNSKLAKFCQILNQSSKNCQRLLKFCQMWWLV